MAPRGRYRKKRITRMDAAIDAMIPFGFSEEIVRRTVKDLLIEYGGDEGWPFLEGDAYKLLIETILDEQDKCEQEERKQQKCAEDENLLKITSTSTTLLENQDGSTHNGTAGDNVMASAAGPSEAFASTCSEVVDTALQTIETECKYHLLPAKGDGEGPKDIVLKEIDKVTGSDDRKSGHGVHLDKAPFQSTPPVTPSLLPVNSLPTRRRKPCHGWISSDEEDDDFIELPPLPPLPPATLPRQAGNLTGGMDKQGKRRTRWDVRPEDV